MKRKKNLVILFMALLLSVFLHSQTPKKPKIYITVDMEGIGQAVSQTQTRPGDSEYEKARKWLTNEVNSCIDGCLEAGAGEIVVADSHWNAQNIIPDDLNESAYLIRGFPRPMMLMEGIDSSFDGVMIIGAHAKEGTAGAVISHTVWGTKFFEIRVNGISVSETLLNAMIAGEYNVPVIFVAGDQYITEEAKKYLGNIELTVTKESIGWLSAKTKHPSSVNKEIKEKCKSAVLKIKNYKPYKVNPPIKLELVFKNTYDAESLSFLPCFKRLDGHTVFFEAKNMKEISGVIAAIFSINTR
ncbi:MAG: M55 family metallopeptidase [Candidatus Aminicenantia bacterium]